MISKPGMVALDFQCSPGWGQDIDDVLIEVLLKYSGFRMSASEMPSGMIPSKWRYSWGSTDWKGAQEKGLSLYGFCSLREDPSAPERNLEMHCGYWVLLCAVVLCLASLICEVLVLELSNISSSSALLLPIPYSERWGQGVTSLPLTAKGI